MFDGIIETSIPLSWTGISSPKSSFAAHHCPCCNHYLHDPNLDHLLDVLYSSDEFRMYHFKVQRCPSSRIVHDWTDCPYYHREEKARRRDPRKFLYSSQLCANYKKNGWCPKEDECQFAHGVFEVWLHPDKYRTKYCRERLACKRKVCFFAHSEDQLRCPGSDSDLTSESEVLSAPVSPSNSAHFPTLSSLSPVSPSNSAHLPTLSSLVSAVMADMQPVRSKEIGKNRSFCAVDMLRDGAIEAPDIKWVYDLVNF